jgi:hypothetical protein
MAVRAAIPWYFRWLVLLALVLMALFFARSAYDFGKKFGGFDQTTAAPPIQRLADNNPSVAQELASVRAQLAQSERQLQMERATHADLVKQMKSLAGENATLKEDLAFFQTLMPSGGKEGGVAVNRFIVQNDALPGEYRYRLLLTQTGQRNKDFLGRLQFIVNLQQPDQKKVVMTLPAEGDKADQAFKLNFHFYQRIEGTFRVDAGTVVKSMQVRVFENGSTEPKLTQAVDAS